MKLVKFIESFIGGGVTLISLGTVAVTPASAAFIMYGDADVLGTTTYSSDPMAGATLEELSPDTITLASQSFDHNWPFSPSPTDFPGTDQIYVSGINPPPPFGDGYSSSPQRINGPQNITLDYSSLVSTGEKIDTLTLGIAADDFQSGGNPFFLASVNGVSNSALTNHLNSLFDPNPPLATVRFFTIGIDPSILNSNHKLVLSIDNERSTDGWAVDFLTIGATTSQQPNPTPVPEPLTIFGSVTAFGFGAFFKREYSRRQKNSN